MGAHYLCRSDIGRRVLRNDGYRLGLERIIAGITEFYEEPGKKPVRFWGSLGPLPALFLLGALIFNWQSRRRRYLILVSFLCVLINTLTTGLYFVPALRVMFSPDGGGLSGAELTALGNNWILGTWGRAALLLVSLVVSVWAMSVPLPKAQAAERAESEAEDAI